MFLVFISFLARSVHEMFAKNAEFGVETSYDPKLRGYTTELKVRDCLVVMFKLFVICYQSNVKGC